MSTYIINVIIILNVVGFCSISVILWSTSHTNMESQDTCMGISVLYYFRSVIYLCKLICTNLGFGCPTEDNSASVRVTSFRQTKQGEN